MRVSDNCSIDFHHNISEKKTGCVLKVYEETFTSEAKCNEKDQYCRGVGRMLTLKRVLKKSSLSRSGRTLVWKTMRDRKVGLITA